jgi:hypothetical protein
VLRLHVQRRPWRRLAPLATACAVPVTLAAQERVASVRLVDGAGQAIASARLEPATTARPVTITRRGDGGQFRVTWRDADSMDVRATALGFAPATVRLGQGTRRVTMRSRFGTLGTVRVAGALRGPPRPVDAFTPDAAASTAVIGFGAVSADQEGGVAAIAAAAPYVYGATRNDPVTPTASGAAGFSVLGLPAARSVAYLDEMRVPLASVPRDALLASQLLTASFDAARGGTSGAALHLNTLAAPPLAQRTLRVSLDDRAAHWGDAVGAALTPAFRAVQTSALATAGTPRASGSLAAQLGWRHRTGVTWAESQEVLGGVRQVAPVVQRDLVEALATQGVPRGPTAPDDMTRTAAFLARGDLRVHERLRTRALVGMGHVEARQAIVGGNAFATGGLGSTAQGAFAQLRGSLHVPAPVLHELAIGGAREHTVVAPTTPGFTGSVIVPATDGGARAVEFGAAAIGPARLAGTAADLAYAITARTTSGRHQWRSAFHVRHDVADLTDASGTRPQVTFADLAAVSAGTATVITARDTTSVGRARVVSADAALAAVWAPRPNVRVQYGVRGEVDHWNAPAIVDPRVGALVAGHAAGRRHDWGLSPRLGVEWRIRDASEPGAPYALPSGIVLTGGFGHFRQTPTAAALLALGTQTAAAPVTSCFGRTSLAAGWIDSLAAAPLACPEGTTPLTAARSAVRFASSYRQPVSWRSAIGVEAPLPAGLRGGVEWIASVSPDEPLVRDVNFAAGAAIPLPHEADRPAWIDPQQVQAARGIVAPSASRRDPSLGSVTVLESTGASTAQQLAVAVRTARAGLSRSWSLFYVWRHVTDRTNGFAATTAGDPRGIERGRGMLDVRHQVGLSVATRLGDLAFLTAYLRWFSGLPYTPLVASDINGDGFVNDRAFIERPLVERAVDSGGAAPFARLDARARRCLAAQVGTIAGMNSCRAPWTTSAAVQLTFNSRVLRLPDRATLSLVLVNVVSGFDYLINGDRLRGWGEPRAVDPRFLVVRGFDAAARRFLYDVNPGFGAASPERSPLRSPFRVMLDCRIALGPRPAAWAAERLVATATPRGDTLDAARLLGVLRGAASNVPQLVLQHGTLLALTDAQRDSLRAEASAFEIRADTLWMALVADPVFRDARGRGPHAARRLAEAQGRVFDLVLASAEHVRNAILTPAQRARLPMSLQRVLDPATARELRPRTSPAFDAAFFPR